MNLQALFFFLGSLAAFLGVGAGAFGAHALKHKLGAEMLGIFEVGVRYQMYHALALLIVAWACGVFSVSLVASAGWLFVVGTLIFSGSLYILALSGVRAWGAVTPIGGVLLLIGWLLLLLAALKDGLRG
jgi:uncharacterized membrane protein YgdD (TMEM256/DUF423 family)